MKLRMAQMLNSDLASPREQLRWPPRGRFACRAVRLFISASGVAAWGRHGYRAACGTSGPPVTGNYPIVPCHSRAARIGPVAASSAGSVGSGVSAASLGHEPAGHNLRPLPVASFPRSAEQGTQTGPSPRLAAATPHRHPVASGAGKVTRQPAPPAYRGVVASERKRDSRANVPQLSLPPKIRSTSHSYKWAEL
jgi:hypothetical protein